MSSAGGQSSLNVDGLAKAYGPTIALRHVTLDLQYGEVHALLGENGAGKSTLVKVLSGIVAPDSGDLMLNGKPYRPHSLMDARRSGVSTAFQELSLLTNLSVAANLLLPTLLKGASGLASTRLNQRRASEILAEFDATDISPQALVSELTLAEKQRLEIVRALSHRPRVLVLDEPTAALAEPEWLFRLIDRIIGTGDVAILYISHRLAEVRRLCRRGTVLRNGESIGTVSLNGTADADIFRMMVGSSPSGDQAKQAARIATAEPPAIAVRGLTGAGVSDVSFAVHRGEIVGVAALEGQGQRELLRMLAGVERVMSGSIEVDGHPLNGASPASALKAGIGFVPEERKSEGIFLGLATSTNISLSILDRLRRFGLIDRRRERDAVHAEAARVELAGRYLDMRISALSGGNQQKALVARVLLSGARNLVLFDPTRGVDVGTKQVIYGVIRDFVARGGSVLIYSTELAEIVQLVHRCVVLYRGRIMGELSAAEMSEERLVSLATGHAHYAEAAE
ncbi:sugar ABC transporter ATP-binding protein [Acidisoma sp.]|uniref:sugar ABC transporter ATP-binding protein n=1 Tax=Acidisoma sp. TaxID=1872115 RepID=UPI003B00F356